MSSFDTYRSTTHANPFIIPENYFVNFTERMMARIDAEVRPRTQVMPLLRWIPWLGAACVACLMVFFTQLNPQKDIENVNSTAQAVQSADDDAAYDYLMLSDAANLAVYETDY